MTDNRSIGDDMKYTELANQLSIWSQGLGGASVVLDSVSSTSDYLRAHWPAQAANGHAWSVCVAKMQTAGRGRQGHEWCSEPGAGLWFSLAVPVALHPGKLHEQPPLSLVLALALIQQLRQAGFAVALKWPNDLWLAGKKLGGLLVELLGASDTRFWLVGVGVNFQPPRVPIWDKTGMKPVVAAGLLDEAPMDSAQRVEISIALITQALACLQAPDTWVATMQKINQLNALSGRRVQVWTADQMQYQGLAGAINPDGTLQLTTDDGQVCQIGGSLSVRLLA